MSELTDIKKSITHIIYLLDESGSMMPVAKDVIGGFNGYIAERKKDNVDYRFTVIKFNTGVKLLCKNVSLEKVPVLTECNYIPHGSTALYDAIGEAFKSVRGTKKKPYGKENVIFITHTDGEENASRIMSKQQIVAEIKKREEAGNWTNVYMGADQDAWSISRDLGYTQGNTMSYASVETGGSYYLLSRATTTSATSTQDSTHHFFDPSKSIIFQTNDNKEETK